MEEKTNRLINEKSPYLLQHAYNPVDWYPWCDEAFNKAADANRSIFLSIGYSTCHWCHVMEKESFEDPEVAELMNREMVSIKVDREERPDLDNIYMSVCQILTGSGGWPLTIIMTPDKVPFFAGTYIPKNTRFGRIGMMELIPRIKDAWENRPGEVLDSAERIQEALRGMDDIIPGRKMGESILEKAYGELTVRFDETFGGFGSAPKFPSPHNLLFLLRYWNRTGDEKALYMVEKSLLNMRLGGIYDHIGSGFHRYSTDREWLVPHFEKMLYDQAMLAMVYTEAFQATGNNDYESTAREIFSYVLRDMTSPEGGFYSAEDADSEGEEGKFYIWKEKELHNILQKEDAELITEVFNIKKEGNFKDEATGDLTGANIFHLKNTIQAISMEKDIPLTDLKLRLSAIRDALFTEREKRIHPHKDDKILTDWNGLMIAALALGAKVFDEDELSRAARKAADFILNNMRDTEGRLLHRYRENEAGITGNADDYAFFIWGLIELYEATFETKYLQNAIELNEYFIIHFFDDKRGGFFFTPDNGEKLLVRKREVYDGAVPSGNSVAMLNLIKLARITGRVDFEKYAERLNMAFSQAIDGMPSGHTFFMCALEYAAGPSCEVVITGAKGSDDTNEMIYALNRQYYPNKTMVLKPEDNKDYINSIAEYLKNYKCLDNRATAYVCHDNTCESPTTQAKEMMALMKKSY
ncbi:thioredoxin domain-containing protein [Thermodesulfobacteriota bacterium]